MNVVDEIKARLDIVQYIEGEGVSLKRSGAYLKACCPFHDENTPSFMVSPDRQTWRCYGACAEGGDVIAFAMKRHNWSFAQAIDELARKAGVKREKALRHTHISERVRNALYEASDAFIHAFLHSPAHAYWEGRGFSLDTAALWGIGYAPKGWDELTTRLLAKGFTPEELITAGITRKSEKGKLYDYFRDRLIIPIRDAHGRLTGFGGRALSDDDTPKYLNSPASVFEKERHLFGYDKARDEIERTGRAVVVEGYLDVIACHEHGYGNVVGLLGTAFTEPQRKLCGDNRLILALDGDKAGAQSTRRALESLRHHDVRAEVVRLDGLDPDQACRKGVWANALEKPLSALEFLIEQEAIAPEGASENERIYLAQDVLEKLAGFGGAIEQERAKDLIAERLGVSAFWLRQAKITPSAPRLTVVKDEPARSKFPIEAYLLSAFVEDIAYLMLADDALWHAGAPPLCDEDFIGYVHVFRVAREAEDNPHASEYMQAKLAPDALVWGGVERGSRWGVQMNTLRLRQQTLRRQIEACAYDEPIDHERVRQLLLELNAVTAAVRAQWDKAWV